MLYKNYIKIFALFYALIAHSAIQATEQNFIIEEKIKLSQQELEEIYLFRINVWRQETTVNDNYIKEHLWIDKHDEDAIYWLARDKTSNAIIGCARLTLHATREDCPSGYLWIDNKRDIPCPFGYLSSLAIDTSARGCGLGTTLNSLRIEKAKTLGVSTLISTVSEKNRRLLLKLGFIDTAFIAEPDESRPGVIWYCLEYHYDNDHSSSNATALS